MRGKRGRKREEKWKRTEARKEVRRKSVRGRMNARIKNDEMGKSGREGRTGRRKLIKGRLKECRKEAMMKWERKARRKKDKKPGIREKRRK